MLIKITSNNPDLDSLLRKNPESYNGIQLKKIKNGTGICKLVSNKECILLFQDSKYSYLKDFSNQLDFNSLCDPRAYIDLVSSFLRHIISDKESYMNDEIPWLNACNKDIELNGSFYLVEIDSILIDRNKENSFLKKSFKNIKIKRKYGKIYSLSVKRDSLFEAINVATLLLYFFAAENKNDLFLDKTIVKKILRIANNTAPHKFDFVKQLSRNVIRDNNIFNSFKKDVEQLIGLNADISPFNSQQNRISFVKDSIVIDKTIDSNIVEIGCNKLEYPKRFMSYLKSDCYWHAVDVVDYSKEADKLSKQKNLDNLIFSTEVPDIKNEKVVALFVEVIEHMPIDKASKLIKSVIFKTNPEKIIITTPNRSFNKYFSSPDGFRHKDHFFEFTEDELREFILQFNNYSPEYFKIGDIIDGESITLGVELKRI